MVKRGGRESKFGLKEGLEERLGLGSSQLCIVLYFDHISGVPLGIVKNEMNVLVNLTYFRNYLINFGRQIFFNQNKFSGKIFKNVFNKD